MSDSNIHTNNDNNLKEAIMDYVSNSLAPHKPIKSKFQIFRDLDVQKNFGLSRATFYRYLDTLGVIKDGTGKIIIDTAPRPKSICNYITPQKYNKTLVYTLEKPEYGSLIARKLNEINSDYKDYFYFTSINDLLICFYYYSSKDKNSYTKKELEEYIYSDLSDFTTNLD